MNKFNVPDAEPFVVNYISFAGYDGAPMEFFYNCKPSNPSYNKNDQLFSSNVEKKVIETNPTIKKVKFDTYSRIELTLLLLNVMTLMISISILVCFFSMQ